MWTWNKMKTIHDKDPALIARQINLSTPALNGSRQKTDRNLTRLFFILTAFFFPFSSSLQYAAEIFNLGVRSTFLLPRLVAFHWKGSFSSLETNRGVKPPMPSFSVLLHRC